MVTVRFINRSAERVILHQAGGSMLKVLEAGKCWNRDPSEGTLGTVVVGGKDQSFPAPRAKPYWIKETEWTWNECPDDSSYAPFKMIVFLDGNKVKLKRRPFWKSPEMQWPVVTFLFKSHKMKMHRERLDKDIASDAAVFYNGIPCRRTVNPLSKYAPYKNWIFDEAMVLRDANPPMKQMIESYEIIELGEDKRPDSELERISKLKAKDEELKELGLV